MIPWPIRFRYCGNRRTHRICQAEGFPSDPVTPLWAMRNHGSRTSQEDVLEFGSNAEKSRSARTIELAKSYQRATRKCWEDVLWVKEDWSRVLRGTYCNGLGQVRDLERSRRQRIRNFIDWKPLKFVISLPYLTWSDNIVFGCTSEKRGIDHSGCSEMIRWSKLGSEE